MFGKQGMIPGISDGNPATREPILESDCFRKELINRQRAEDLYRNIDANERLQKCLSQRTYGYSDNKYKEGDEVLFKEEDKGRWSGPAKVTGMEGSKVRIIHAGYDRTVPSCRVIPFEDKRELVVGNNDEKNENIFEQEQTPVIEASEEDHKEQEDVIPTILEMKKEIRPKMRKKILFKLPGDQEWRAGRVSRVGKQNGRDKFRCWIKSKTEEVSYDFHNEAIEWKYCRVDFTEDTKDSDDESKVTTEVLYTENDSPMAIYVTNIPEKEHHRPEVIEAKRDELDKWVKYEAFEVVDEHEDQHVLGSRWVVQDRNGKIKARFVVKGCQEKSDPRSDSPTASKDSFKLFLALAANENFDLKTLDVTSAFLQGYPLEREVFIQPPLEKLELGKVWKLKKSCYGLYDASRKWFLAVKESLKSMQMKSLSGDDAFFYMIENKKLTGLILLHVDDFMVAGNPTFLKLVEKKLEKRFTFGKVECRNFKFTGLYIRDTKEGIMVDQNEYI